MLALLLTTRKLVAVSGGGPGDERLPPAPGELVALTGGRACLTMMDM